jgi:hypothetical protein
MSFYNFLDSIELSSLLDLDDFKLYFRDLSDLSDLFRISFYFRAAISFIIFSFSCSNNFLFLASSSSFFFYSLSANLSILFFSYNSWSNASPNLWSSAIFKALLNTSICFYLFKRFWFLLSKSLDFCLLPFIYILSDSLISCFLFNSNNSSISSLLFPSEVIPFFIL